MLESKENNTEEKKVTSARRSRRTYAPKKREIKETEEKEIIKKEVVHRVSKNKRNIK